MPRLIGVVLAVAGSVLGAVPQPDGLWLFDDPGHLAQSTVGSDLIEVGTHAAVSGMVAGDGAVQDPLGSHFICSHGLSANDGGSYVNQWTLLLDINMPTASLGRWISLYQTNVTNSNDGDCFIANNESIGVGATGYSTQTLAGETWRRVVISVSNPNFYRIYVDGTKWLEGTVQALDGRFALESTILLFADENGDDYPIRCTCAAVWGQALTDAQIGAMGGPSNSIQIATAAYAGVNQLANPSAETELSDWTAATGCDWQASDRTDWHFPHRGSYFFTPGRTAAGELSQTVSLGFLAAEIDGGRVIGKARGSLGGKNADQGRILTEYLDADEGVLLSADSGWIAGPSATAWQDVALPDCTVPAGTRAVCYRFQTQRTEGMDCEAFGDDFVWEYSLAAAGNNMPNVPAVNSSSTTGTINDDIAFMFSATDADGDPVAFDLDWGDGSTVWSDMQGSGANYIVSHRWPAPGTYLVKGRARDARGMLSDWTLPLQVTITGQAAGVFKSQPYLQNVSTGGISIVWESDRLVQPRVDWGLTASYGNQTTGLCIPVAAGVYICKVPLAGLSAGTLYHYRVRNGSTLSADAVFSTAPSPDTPFTFAVWGDSQRNENDYNPTPVTEAMLTNMFAAMAGGTDLGVAVGDVVESSSYTHFANPFRKYVCNILGRQKPFAVAFGNHDEPSNSLVHKAVQNSGMQTFSFNYGNAHFTCISYSQLNDNTLPYDDSISSLPLEWLQQDLSSDAAQNATWRFVFVHIPPYCERWFDGSSILRTHLVPLLNQYRVQICFSGHTHEYQRGCLDGTYYVITGCGSYLDTAEVIVRDWPHMTVGGDQNIGSLTGGLINGYAAVEINGTELTLKQHAYNPDGSYYGVIDTLRLLVADFTGDGRVDMDDFGVMARAWNTTKADADWNPACDLADRANQAIDISDLAELVKYWQNPPTGR